MGEENESSIENLILEGMSLTSLLDVVIIVYMRILEGNPEAETRLFKCRTRR